VALRAGAAKEIRVFGLAGWLSDHYRAPRMEILDATWAERRRIYLLPYLRYTAFGFVVAAIVLAAVGRAAATGAISLTQLALALQAALAALRLGEAFPESDTATQFGMLAYDGVEGSRGAWPRSTRRRSSSSPAGPVGLPRREISFEMVDFHYPGSERPVLDGSN